MAKDHPAESAAHDSGGLSVSSDDLSRPPKRLIVTLCLFAGALLSVGGLCFVWLSWVLSGSSVPWNDSWTSWVGKVSPADWVSAATSAGTVLLALAAAVLAAVAVRRQSVAENNLRGHSPSHRTAVQQLEVSRQAHLAAERHARVADEHVTVDRGRLELQAAQLEVHKARNTQAEQNALRERFTSAATLLSQSRVSMRLAGAYALARLANDWHTFGDDDERQACINLLCDQLRLPPTGDEDFELHRCVVSIIRRHRPLPSTAKRRAQSAEEEDAATWTTCTLDLTRAHIPGVNLIDTDLRDVVLQEANLAGASLAHSVLSSAAAGGVDLDSANLVGVDFSEADLRHARMTNCGMTGAIFARADLSQAELGGSDMTKAVLTGAILKGTDMAKADLAEALLDATTHDAWTTWPSHHRPPRSNGR